MKKEVIAEVIADGREFLKFQDKKYPTFVSDQDNKLPMPPLVKEAISEEIISLSKDFNELSTKSYLDIVEERTSTRAFTNGKISLLELSFLLWTTQGIKGYRQGKYATMRTVPSGGARHPFETYLVVQNVEGLNQGLYHYLPVNHELEFIKPIDNIPDKITNSLCKQAWASKANVVFYWSIIPYRCEWRYGVFAHRIALVDIGHVGQNLYLSCSALNLGTCGIGAFDDTICNELLELDGKEEFVIYSAPVGTKKLND